MEERDGVSFMSGGGWVYWLMEKKKHLTLVLPLVLLGLLFSFKFAASRRGSEADFVAAHVAFTTWERDGDEKSFEKLTGLMSKYKELERTYDGKVVQKLIAKGDFEHAFPMASRTLKRSSDLAASYTQFGKTTLLIGKKDYKAALKESEDLKERLLSSEEERGSLLFGFNLLRIAFLHQKLGQREEELLAWKQLKHYAGWDGNEPALPKEAFDKILSHYTESQVNLLDYIRYRESQP